MKIYNVTIMETLETTVPVMAESATAAVAKAYGRWTDSEIELMPDTFTGVEIIASGKDGTTKMTSDKWGNTSLIEKVSEE